MPQQARDKVSSPEASRPLPKKQKEPWDIVTFVWISIKWSKDSKVEASV